MASPTVTSLGHRRRLINRPFALLWSGQVISEVGDAVFGTTLLLWIVVDVARNAAWAPLAVSGLLMAETLPMLVVAPLAGVWVDRWDARRTLLSTEAQRAVLLTILFLTASLGGLSAAWRLGITYGICLLAGGAAQFFMPARLSYVQEVVPEAEQTRAVGLLRISENVAVLVGPPLAAPLLFGLGIHWALAINALSFVVSFLAIRWVRPSATMTSDQAPKEPFFTAFHAGLREFAENHTLRALAAIIMVFVLGGGALNALDLFFVVRNLHAPASMYGTLLAAYGVGAILGASLASAYAERLGLERVIWATLVGWGLLIVVLAEQTQVAAVFVIFPLLGILNAALNVAVGSLQMWVTPRHLMGRVSAVLKTLVSIAALIATALAGYLLSGPLHDWHPVVLGHASNPITAILVGVGAMGLIGGGCAWRTLRRFAPIYTARSHASFDRLGGAMGDRQDRQHGIDA